MKIKNLIDKNYSVDAKFQRSDSVWSSKLKSNLIDSIMNDYYIPPILVANNEVIDGKQRYTTIKEYKKNKFEWKNQNSSKKFTELSANDQSKFLEFDFNISDLGKISDEKIRETFIRINEGSIKLNKTELLMAKMTENNRSILLKIAKNDNIKKISNNKKSDRRFNIVNVIARCLTIIYMNTGSKGIRQQIPKLFAKDLDNQDQIIKKSNMIVDTMWDILGNDTIPSSSFNTIFESIFCAIYQNFESLNSYLKNKNEIKKRIIEKIEEIKHDQMGGGIKFDSIIYVRKRIEKIQGILSFYNVDDKRSFTYDEKLKLWKEKEHICEECKKIINDINDFEPDHIIPHTLGGRTDIKTNARILCKKCNRILGAKIKSSFQ